MYSLIIIDYNSMDETMEYIKHFKAHSTDFEHCHPIVIDNYNSIEKGKELMSKFGIVSRLGAINEKEVYTVTIEDIKIYYCCYGLNAGFAKGNNLGAKIARTFFQDKYYLFSNNDIVLNENFDIYHFECVFSNNIDIGVIGPRVTSPSGKEQSPCRKISTFRQLFLNYWAYALPFLEPKSDLDYTGESKKCYWVSGCFMLVKADIFDAIDGFDEATFLYCEEMILAERIIKKTASSYYCSEYKITHLGGGTTKKTSSVIRIMEMRFQSLCYYQREYRNCPKVIISLARINFQLYKLITILKGKIRRQ